MNIPVPEGPLPAVGVVCLRGPVEAQEVLLIRRADPPLRHAWSVPGGRLFLYERAVHAAVRELEEETGVTGEILGLVDVVDGFFPSSHYVLVDYAARWVSGEPRPGSDALEARFIPLSEIGALGLWGETARVIAEAHRRFGAAACAGPACA